MVDTAADVEAEQDEEDGEDDDDEAEAEHATELKADDLLEADPEADVDDDDNEDGDNDHDDGDDGDDDDGEENEEKQDGAEEDQEDDADAAGDDAGGETVKKRRGKPKDPDAPKKPLNAYSQFTQSERPKMLERRPELKSDLGGLGKALAEAWAQFPQEQKDTMTKEYERLKAIYDVEFAKYKATDKYKAFQKVFNEWKHGREMKKLLKKQKQNAPKKPQSGYMAFAASARPKLLGKGLSMGELGKEVAQMWAALGSAKQQEHSEGAKKAKVAYEAEMLVYRRSEQFRRSVDEQAALELKQGLQMLKLENADSVPKRSPLPFQLYASATGQKGSMSVMSSRFKELPDDQQQQYITEAKQLQEAFKADTAAFWASPVGCKMQKQQGALRLRVGVRAARRKFLVDAPTRPVSAAALYADSGSSSESWAKLPNDERQKWEEKRAKLNDEYKQKLEEFKTSEAYKTFEKAVHKLQGKAKGKATAKSKPKAGAKAKAKASAKPASMPQKPQSANKLFVKEQAGKITGGLAAFQKAWSDLGAEGQKPYVEKARAAEEQYKTEMAAWSKSKDGKKHEKAVANDKKKAKEQKARSKYLVGADAPKQPDKPKTAVQIFLEAKRSELMKENAKLGARELSRKAGELWSALDADGRKTYEDQAKEKLATYEKELSAYKATPAYKKYEKMAGLSTKAKTQKVPRGAKRGAGKSTGASSAKKAKLGDDDIDDILCTDSDSDIMGSDDSDSDDCDFD